MKKNKKIILVFLLGIALRLYPAIKQPLWLDEIYSLYYASNFSPASILFRLPDCHPGGFYLILKGLLALSTNSFFLRLVISAIPQLLGCFLIQKRFKKSLLTTLFLLNPFLVHYSWQIRMYGLVFLITIATISLITLKKFSTKKFIIILFIANLISYSFIIPTLCLLLYLAYTYQKKWLLVIPLIFVEFLIFKGPQYKSYAEIASWISPPSFTNTPSVILTSLGFDHDLNSQNYYSIFSSLIFYLIFGIFTLHCSKKHLLFLFTFTIPLLLTIFASLAFPFLSQHYFFYLFVPNLSLFLPRFLIPLSLIFYLYLFKFFPSPFLLLILLPFWMKTNSAINFTSFYPPRLPLPNSQNQLILPPWENLRLKPSFSFNDIKKISSTYDTAQNIDKSLFKSPEHPDCTILSQYPQVAYIDQNIKSLDLYQKQIKLALKNCSKSH